MREPQDWRAARHQEEEGLKKKKDDDDEEVQEVDDEKKYKNSEREKKFPRYFLKKLKFLMEISSTKIHYCYLFFIISLI